MHRRMRPLIVLFLWLAACTPQGAPMPKGGRATAGATNAPVPTPVKTEAVVAPNGTPRATLICYEGYMQLDCSTHFPNGNVLRYGPGKNDWSPDGNYAIVCVGFTHDSPCSGFQVWDMLTGEVKRQLGYQDYIRE